MLQTSKAVCELAFGGKDNFNENCDASECAPMASATMDAFICSSEIDRERHVTLVRVKYYIMSSLPIGQA
jgi:hypothetical protein